MQFGLNLGMPGPLPAAEQLDEWRRTLAVAEECEFSFVSVLHQWLSHPFSFLSPFQVIAWMAAQFPSFEYMTGVLQLPVLNPAQLAEDVVSADYFSGGRFSLGVGLGYRPELFAAAGARRGDRVARFVEAVDVMRKLWTGESVAHTGRFYDVHGQLARRPIQDPHPPIVVGAQSDGGVRRAGAIADGWCIPSQVGDDDLARLIPIYLAARAQSGREGPGILILTRNVCIAATDEEAVEHASTFMADTFGAYRRWGLEEPKTVRVHRSFEEEISERSVVGSAETCARRLAALAGAYPVTHLLLRPQGPGFSGSEDGLRRSLRLLSEQVLPAVEQPAAL